VRGISAHHEVPNVERCNQFPNSTFDQSPVTSAATIFTASDPQPRHMAGSISYDAVVVGSGPNGLAAAIRLAQKKLSVLLVEANAEIGGGVRSAELTLPGFVHDLCSAIHPLALGSPFVRGLGLEKYGLRWIQPEYPLAHPLNEGKAAVLQRWVSSTAVDLGRDNLAYQKLFLPLVKDWETLAPELLRPMLHWPRHPFQLASFGRRAMRSAAGLVNRLFSEEPARALFSGLAAHSFLPLEASGSAAFGLVLGTLGHAVGWPLVHGGSQKLADSLAAHFRALSGEIATNWRVTNIDQLPLGGINFQNAIVNVC
jgi:phytoene dehydrogenase-like protein